MALINFCYYVTQFFFGVFFILMCIVVLVAGVIGLVLLCTPFPYFPIHRKFLIRLWTFAVTSLLLENDAYYKEECGKVKNEMRQLASWDTAKSVTHLANNEKGD